MVNSVLFLEQDYKTDIKTLTTTNQILMKHVIYNYSDNDIDFIVVLLHKATRSTFCIISRTRILEKDSFQHF